MTLSFISMMVSLKPMTTSSNQKPAGPADPPGLGDPQTVPQALGRLRVALNDAYLRASRRHDLTPQQAEIITVAQQMADRLTLALRSITDTQEKNLPEADYLVSGNGRRGTVRLIKSGEVSEVGARK